MPGHVSIERRLGVAHLLAPGPFGGLETVVGALAAGQLAIGTDVTVIGVFPEAPREQPFWEELLSSGVRAIPIVVAGRNYVNERRDLRAALKRTAARILHTHGYRPDVVGAPVAHQMGIPTVTTIHGFTGGGLRNRVYEWLQVRSLRRFDAVIAVSEKLRTELAGRGVPSNLLHCIQNGWSPQRRLLERDEARQALGVPADGTVIAWVGRMSEEKGPDIMLEAFCQRANSSACLSFVGDGPMRDELERRARRRKEAGRHIRWHGATPRAGRLLRAFDVLVMTSRTEGTPMVLLEAMAAGVPVVATAVGGVPDVLSPREGRLVDSLDPLEIARAIDSVLAEPAQAAARATAARTRVLEQFAVEPWVLKYQRVYRSCLGATSGRA